MLQHNLKIIIFGYVLSCWQFASAASANTELSKKIRDCTEIELEAVINQDASREDNLARLSQQFFQSVNTIEHCDREQDNADAASSTDSDSASSNADADRGNVAYDGTATTDTKASTDPIRASSAQTTTPSNSENPTNIDADNTAIDSSANSMKATQNISQLDTQPISQSGGQSGGQSSGQATRSAITSTASGSLVGTNLNQTTMTDPAPTFSTPSASNMAGKTPQPTPTKNDTGAQAGATEKDARLTNGKTPDDIPNADNDSVFEAQIRAAAMAETDPDTKRNLWNEYRRYKGLPEQK